MIVKRSQFIKVSTAMLFLSGVLLLAGCATVPRPQECILPGKEVETIQSSVSIAVRTGDKSTGGRGYLVYRRPDRFHLVLLSPFGQTLFEVYMNGERITCLVPSRAAVYTGFVSELPDSNPLKNWGLMRWATERPPTGEANPGVRECIGADGRPERVTYDNQGMVTEKENEVGDRVIYSEYETVNGVPLPKIVEFYNRRGDAVRIVFDEPEVNQAVEAASFTPPLEGKTVLPLTAFPGL